MKRKSTLIEEAINASRNGKSKQKAEEAEEAEDHVPPEAEENEDHVPPLLSARSPVPMAKEAYIGLAGRFVETVSPASEADPVALLVQFLLGVGNMIGRTAHAKVESDCHYLNENAVLVGRSAKGRKGTSMGRTEEALALADPNWCQDRIMSGLSSGEGLIWQVRDPIERLEKGPGRGASHEKVVSDPGIQDKRLCIVEPEFANVLRQTERHGNNLSATLRQAWDKGNLRSMVKNNPTRSTDAHITLIGHITSEELTRYLTATESANGFGNRFMWFLVQRSKLLPEGGTPDESALKAIGRDLKAVVSFARSAGEIRRSSEARKLWAEVYPVLSRERYGLSGSLTGRAEAHVLRLSVLYAVLDRSKEVLTQHLKAALAVWDYSEDSVTCIFGNSTGNPLADAILGRLRGCSTGLPRNEIRELLGKHLPADRIEHALKVLLERNLVRREQRQTGGRPLELWFLSSSRATT